MSLLFGLGCVTRVSNRVQNICICISTAAAAAVAAAAAAATPVVRCLPVFGSLTSVLCSHQGYRHSLVCTERQCIGTVYSVSSQLRSPC
jgi:hypothetical protein